jgi:hypothetical protein
MEREEEEVRLVAVYVGIVIGLPATDLWVLAASRPGQVGFKAPH